MALRLHPRTQMVDRARFDLQERIAKWAEEHDDLTYIEALQCLLAGQADLLKYALRAERHPDDPEKKADEE